jgi:KAP-like P-loop domain-containing protein
MIDDLVCDIWADDTLGRKEDAELIRRFLVGQQKIRSELDEPKAYVLNLDSRWGGGKTFFLKRFKRYLEVENHVCAYVNAWDDDHSEDPLIAVVAAINEQISSAFADEEFSSLVKSKLTKISQNAGIIVTKALIGAAKQVAKKAIGEDGFEGIGEIVADEMVDAIAASALDNFQKQKTVNTSFRADLEDMIETVLASDKIEGPIFVLIDELDRCRPVYAIKLLERIKHLFSVDNIVFVIATDTEQLGHAVAGTYGARFDGMRYLKRFFDRSYHFPNASKQDFIVTTFSQLGLKDDMFSVPETYSVPVFLTLMLDLPELALRDIKQILDMVQTFLLAWPHGKFKIELAVLLPLAYEQHIPKSQSNEDPSAIRMVVLKSPKRNMPITQEIAFHEYSVQRYLGNLEKHWDDISKMIEVGSDPILYWIQRLFVSELDSLHRNPRSEIRPSSVLKSYPELLGKLSRLDRKN